MPNPQKSHILMIHRVAINNNVSKIYKLRSMCVDYEKLERLIEDYLKGGFNFGSVEECFYKQKFFCLSFDDGFKEHLEVIDCLALKYSIPKNAIICSININNSIKQEFFGMDCLYELITYKPKALCEYFNVPPCKNTLETLKILKEKYLNLNVEAIKQFISAFRVDLSSVFLNKTDIISLSKIVTLASHGVFHRNLTLDLQSSKTEILESKKALEALINNKISLFCYPEGKNNQTLWEFCQEAGYSYALAIGDKGSRYCIGRVDIAKV